MREVALCDRWPLLLPDHRAAEWERFPHWERTRLEALHDVIGPGVTVWDVGAWDGDMSALLGLWGANVHLFEPTPSCWVSIRAIWEANALRKPAGCFHGFVGAETHLHGSAWPPGTTWPECSRGALPTEDSGFCNLLERPDLDRIRLDDYATNAEPPAIITVDVEGAELEVLRGARWLLAEHRPLLFLSVHPEMMFAKHHQYQNELHEFLKGLGYNYQFLAHEHESHYLWRPL